MSRKANQTRTRQFKLPMAVLYNFFYYVMDKELTCTLIEVEDSDTLVVEVHYTNDEREDIMTLIEMLDDHENELSGTDEDEEDEDE